MMNPHARRNFRIGIDLSRSKRAADKELNKSRVTSSGDPPKGVAGRVGVRRIYPTPLSVVEGIQEVSTELDPHSFRRTKCLVELEIECIDAGPAYGSHPLVTLRVVMRC